MFQEDKKVVPVVQQAFCPGLHPGVGTVTKHSAVVTHPVPHGLRVTPQSKVAADTILELTVGLAPVPGFTASPRNGAATFTSIFVNDLVDEREIALGDNPLTVGERNVHENERNKIFF